MSHVEFMSTAKVPKKLLLIPVILILIYGMLSGYAYIDPEGFYEVMEIPYPAHEFFIQSWAGKNTAMLTVLLLSTLSRRLLPLMIAMIMLLVGQAGDAVAGARTDVDVFITYIALALTLIQIGATKGWLMNMKKNYKAKR